MKALRKRHPDPLESLTPQQRDRLAELIDEAYLALPLADRRGLATSMMDRVSRGDPLHAIFVRQIDPMRPVLDVKLGGKHLTYIHRSDLDPQGAQKP